MAGRIATSNGIRGAACDDKSFLHRNAGKMAMIEAKPGSFFTTRPQSLMPPWGNKNIVG